MAVRLYSAEVAGLDGRIIDVEVDVSKGLRSFTVVGLADKAVDEAKERISYAIKNIGFTPPHKQNQKVIVSLAPADIKKEGSGFDLAIALGYLLASKQASFDAGRALFLGELALDGTLRPIRGVLALSSTAKNEKFDSIIVPHGNGAEAALIRGIRVFEAQMLDDVISHLAGEKMLEPVAASVWKETADAPHDFCDVRGQETAKRALEIAAAGGHNVFLSGPPGTGKTLLARALPSILPPLAHEEALEVTAIHSIAGTPLSPVSPNARSDESRRASRGGPMMQTRPFRSPHHTSSYVALVGGGAWPRPGEVTLAHRGVLFLDEFPEFDRRVIEALRQPMEDGVITIARAKGTLQFPARFMLVAAMNPCPCGNLGSKTKECVCPPSAIFRYGRKISGPIADRIDLWTEVGLVDHKELGEKTSAPSSAAIRKRIVAARALQERRYKKLGIRTNSELGIRNLEKFGALSGDARLLLDAAAKKLDLSPRAYHRVIKIARTIADLEKEAHIKEERLAEALQYRPKTGNV
ncbi:MAG: YifB family Mg chelatase-like AAA ATPase [Candidatus Niyogibacteria bacterium]|nr:YifB family Mg chelatase-like AAA ATPase [Candidatus Niyogibacteria bacterium]